MSQPGFEEYSFKAIIKKKLLTTLKNKQDKINQMANEELQKAIRYLDVFDTGNLADNSKAKTIVNNAGLIIQLKTDGSKVGYWSFPRNGLGLGANSEPRKYDRLAAAQIVNNLKLSK